MEKMIEHNYKLYADREISYFGTFEGAKEAAKLLMNNNVHLRIEILVEIALGDADFWAYDYKTNQWVPS